MQKLYFRSDGTFTILQVSDAQDMHFVRKTMLWMLDRGYELVKPDLVLFTGDNILGNHLCDRRFGSGQLPLTEQQEEKRSVDRAGRRSGRVVFVRAAGTAARPLPH